MAVKQVDDPSLYGVVVHDEGRVTGFQEKPPRAEALSDPLQLRHLRVRARRSSTTCRRAPSSTGPRTSSRRCSPPDVPFHCWRAARATGTTSATSSSTGSATSTPCSAASSSTSPAVEIRPRVWVGEGTEIEDGAVLEAADPDRRRLPRRDRGRAHRPAHHRRRLRHRARRRARGRDPLGRRQDRSRLPPGRQHPRRTSSCTTRPSCTRTRSSATARTSRRTRWSRRALASSRARASARTASASSPRASERRPPVDASGALDGLLDLVFPKRCVQCGAAGAWLCEPCAGDLHRLPDERCPRCGAPGRYRRPAPRGGRRDRTLPTAAAGARRAACAGSAAPATWPSAPPAPPSPTRGRRGRS